MYVCICHVTQIQLYLLKFTKIRVQTRVSSVLASSEEPQELRGHAQQDSEKLDALLLQEAKRAPLLYVRLRFK